MLDNNIVSKKFLDKNYLNNEIIESYKNDIPFPNIVIDNFFEENFLNKVLDDFPDLSKIKVSEKYNNKDEVKFANNDYVNFPISIKKLIDFMNSQQFLDFLQKLTSIKEKLQPDKELNGGGLHEIKSGGFLKVHTDFNKHPKFNLDRRINILIYLNKDWKENYGGDLQLWDKDMNSCKKKIYPKFNKMVIFSTNDFSNHGHPDPIKCPENISRKSIALYYFSDGRPDEELDPLNVKNKTYFKNRLGHQNESSYKSENFKNYIRKLKIYKFLKNVEKTYFRKKK